MGAKAVERKEKARPSSRKTMTTTAGGEAFSLWTKVVLAVIALFLGLITPPLLVKAGETETTPGENEDEVCYINDAGESVCATQTLGSKQALFPCNEEVLSQYLNEDPVPGYHVVCFSQVHNEDKLAKEYIQLTYYLDGFWNKTVTQTFPKPYNKWKNIKSGMKRSIKPALANSLKAGFQPWAIFTPLGHRIVDADFDDEQNAELVMDVLLKYQTVLVFEGGQFIWPGIKANFVRHVNLYSIMPMGDPVTPEKDHLVSLRTLSVRPLVFSVDGFLTDQECEYIQEKAAPHMKYSDVVLMDKDKGRPASDFRTSQSAFVSAKDDSLLLDIEFRTASLARIPRMHQEDVQVLRYGVGEKYDHHHDYFDPRLYAEDETTLETIRYGRRNRIATVFWYLSDVEEGGETAFPRFEGMEPSSMQDCQTGLMVNPIKGRALLFYSLLPNGQYDPLSLHGACPVKEGVKWAGNKWLWNEPMSYVPNLDEEDNIYLDE